MKNIVSRLPREIEELKDLGSIYRIYELRELVRVCRERIRYHRDQKGDHRCWLDDYLVWELVEGLPLVPAKLPEEEAKMMIRCTEYFVFRSAPEPDPVPEGAILDRALWDQDLVIMDHTHLVAELLRIQLAIAHHAFWSGLPRVVDQDRLLYKVLPEKLPADFRLPPRNEFLGEAKAPDAGCRSFWRSHQGCPGETCNLHEWGQCSIEGRGFTFEVVQTANGSFSLSVLSPHLLKEMDSE